MTAYMDHKDLANEVIEQSRAREITDGVHRVLDRIAEVESVAGREAGSVHLLAAIKTRDVGEILAAIDAGVHRIGENRPQEIVVKAPGLARLLAERGYSLGVVETEGGAAADAAHHIPFHLIGQLQANKIGKVLPAVDTIESVDSIGAHVDDERTIRAGFAHLRCTRDQILASGAEGTADCTELSMGMTHDMAYAIEEGSTIVRVGTAIFGERAFI